MATSLISLGSYVSSLLGTALHKNHSSTANTSAQSVTLNQPDNSQLSPFAQLLSTLQQLQQSDPGKYQQVTQQIAANLQGAAQTDTNTASANQLTQLATDFTNASKSDQLPNVQELAQAIAGGHHHHGHHTPAASNDSATANPQDALLAAFQSNGGASEAFNPMSIIMNTLTSAGVSG